MRIQDVLRSKGAAVHTIRPQASVTDLLESLAQHNVGALVVSAEDGLDELSISSPTRVVEVADGSTKEWFVAPADVGLAETPLEEIAGGSPEENAAVVEAVLDGGEGPARDVVVLNAGAAILVGSSATDLGDGMDRAREAIDRGAAKGVLDKLRSLASASG